MTVRCIACDSELDSTNGQNYSPAAMDFPKEFLEINGLHNDGFLSSGDKYTNGIDNYIKKILKR